MNPLPTGHATDFDFLAGRWAVHNCRRVAGEWVSFPGTSTCTPYLGGVANVDEIRFPTLGFAGMTLRAFDVSAQRWSIWWVNSRDGLLQPPVHGGFSAGQGLFYGDDVDAGQPVQVRFTWTRTGAGTAHWEQAFRRGCLTAASDADAPWDTNWTMDFSPPPP